IDQGLLAQKANATVQEAIQALQQGEKPVIAVANTMGSFIQAKMIPIIQPASREIIISFISFLFNFIISNYLLLINRLRYSEGTPFGLSYYRC
ncbi:MAG: hypothetical protein AAFW70_25225, partial [Cyanobacteria bacterium J06635_10]